jgi:CxxC motif-containing protein
MIIKKKKKSFKKSSVNRCSNGKSKAWKDIIQPRRIVPHAIRGPAFL